MTHLYSIDYRFLNAMHQAVLSEPVGFIYKQDPDSINSCTYLPTENTVSCIVGRGVLDGGFTTPEALHEYEGKAAKQVLIGDLKYAAISPISTETVTLHPDVVDFAEKVQGWQDSSYPWTVAWNMGVTWLMGKGHDVSHFIDHRDWLNNPNA